MTKSGVNRVLFRIFNRTNDALVVNGKKVYLDTRFDNKHLTQSGKVLQVPFRLDSRPLTDPKEFLGQPHYVCRDNGKGQPHPFYSNRIPKFHQFRDIAPEVKIGDTIFFYYTTLMDPNNNFVSSGFKNDFGIFEKYRGVRDDGIIDNYEVWSVRYDRILCALRENEIIMIGDHVLVEPDMETEDDILHPVYYDPSLTGGKMVLKPKKEWLLVKPNTEPKHRLGWVRKVGTPLKGTETDFKEGDRIVFHKNADYPIEVNGKQYYCMKKNHILATVETDEKVIIS